MHALPRSSLTRNDKCTCTPLAYTFGQRRQHSGPAWRVHRESGAAPAAPPPARAAAPRAAVPEHGRAPSAALDGTYPDEADDFLPFAAEEPAVARDAAPTASTPVRRAPPRRSRPAQQEQQAQSETPQQKRQPPPGTTRSSSGSRHSKERQPQEAAKLPAHLAANAKVRAVLQAAAPDADAQLLAEQLGGSYEEVAAALQLLAAAAAPGAGGPRGMKRDALEVRREEAARRLGEALLDRLTERALAGGSSGSSGSSKSSSSSKSSGISGGSPFAELAAAPLASICFSLGRLQLYDPDCVAALEARSQQLLGGCSPNQLGQLAQGFALLRHAPARPWRAAFAAAAGSAWGRCSSTHLTSIAVAVAAWGDGSSSGSSSSGDRLVLSDSWIDGFCLAVAKQSDELPPRQLAKLLTAAAGLGVRLGTENGCGNGMMAAEGGQRLEQQQQQQQQQQRSAAVDRMADALLTQFHRQLPDCRPGDLAEALLAFAALGAGPLFPPPLLRLVLLQMWLQLPLAGGPEIVDSLWGLQQMGVTFSSVLDPTAASASAAAAFADHGSGNYNQRRQQQPQPQQQQQQQQQQQPRPAPQPAPDPAAALQGADPRQWADAVFLRVYATMPSLDAARLARLGACMGGVLRRRPPPAVWHEYTQRLRIEAPGTAPADLVACLEGLAAARLRLDDEVLSLVAAAARAALPRFSHGELRRLAVALRGMYPKMPGRKMQQLLEEVERRAGWQEGQR
jgi:hypothetical protein